MKVKELSVTPASPRIIEPEAKLDASNFTLTFAVSVTSMMVAKEPDELALDDPVFPPIAQETRV
jgi:hypothetical protein